MKLGKHLDLGALATGTANYTGFHRDVEPIGNDPDIVGIAVGNRSTKPLYGMSEVEERGSDANAWRLK